MKNITSILSALVLILSFFFFKEYMLNHTYYFSMLETSSNWYLVFGGLLVGFGLIAYYFYSKKLSWWKILLSFFVAFYIFSLIIGFIKGGFVSGGVILLAVNYLILFSFYLVILLGSLALGNLVLRKVKFNEAVYDFSIKLAFGFGLLSILIYYVVAVGALYKITSYVIFGGLIVLIFLQKNYIKEIGNSLLESFYSFRKNLSDSGNIKYLYFIFFALVFFYIVIGFNYTFIPYPTAWDANHAYMFIPKVLAEYHGYPWGIDFRPSYTLWSAVLAWIYSLGFWTWFAQDTWMINFNFITGVLSLFFGVLLVRTIVKLLIKDSSKALLPEILGYFLVLTWLTSGMGAFLVFVDNKTDLAVLMYVILGLFLLIYTLFRFKQDENLEIEKESIKVVENGTNVLKEKTIGGEKIDLIFLALSGLFFAIANLIKPTATFDFFESFLSYCLVNVGIFIVIGAILFVVGLLAWINFRNFDKAISSSYSLRFMISGIILAVIDFLRSFVKDKLKLYGLFVFVGSFVGTLILTKGAFGLLQQYHDKNLNKNPIKLTEGLIMNESLPTLPKKELTGQLYKGLKKVIGSSYNEDNGRYVGYGDKDFGSPWWKFLVPKKYKKDYCVVFTGNQTCSGYEILRLSDKNPVVNDVLNKYTLKIYNSLDKNLIDDYINEFIANAEKSGNLQQLAKQAGVNENEPDWELKKDLKLSIANNIKKQVLQQIKSNLKSGKLDISAYNPALNNDKVKSILNKLKNPIIYEKVSIPYKMLIPFNVTFNRSLQNLSSYYTDIGIIWIILAILDIILLVLSGVLIIIYFLNEDKEKLYKAKLSFAFSFSGLVGWAIWLFIADGIVWYDIGGIIWLIVSVIFLVSLLQDREVLIYSLLFVIFLSMGLNLIRIASQGGGQIQTWYRSSIGKTVDYVAKNGGIQRKVVTKMPYKFDDVFSLQFNMYKKPIKAFNERKLNEAGIIGGTYMRYFIKNQNRIVNDQFLDYLWKLGSDNNTGKFYERLKDQGIKEIVLDPNIASVVMGTGNISLWYRYFGVLNKDGTIKEKGVFTNFVDLAESGHLQYGYTNNLGIKYALIYSDKQLARILGIKDLNKVRNIRYCMMGLIFLPRDIGFEFPNSSLGIKLYYQAINAVGKILSYRLQQTMAGRSSAFLSDLADIMGLNVSNPVSVLTKGQQDFNSLSKDGKSLLINFYNLYQGLKQYPGSAKKIIQQLIRQSLVSRAQIMRVKIK